jgi:membrane associated rhomboid family serine protease
MLLPIRSKNPPESTPYATCALIFINLVVYGLTTNGLEIKEESLKKFAVSGVNFDPFHILSSMFLHADIFHILGNMFFLYLFGFAVEGRMRSLKFTALYLASGVAGDLLHHLFIGRLHPDMPSLGASGAIMGVMGAAIFIFPHAKVTMLYGWSFHFGTADWPMWGVGLFYVGIDMLFALIGAGDGIGHFAHLGGAFAGFGLAAAMLVKRDTQEASEAKATLSETKDLQTLTRMELEALHKVNPSDTSVVVNWVYRSMRDPGGIRPNCAEAFHRLLPQIIREQDPGPVAVCILTMNSAPGAVRAVYIADLAARLERSGDNTTAIRLYNHILSDSTARLDDIESATFRVGMLSESAFGNFGRAQTCYKDILHRFPMGPFAEQARVRLAYVSTRVTPRVTPPV